MLTLSKSNYQYAPTDRELSPPDGPQQGRPGLIVEGDDDAGGRQILVIAQGQTPGERKRRRAFRC